MTHPNGNVGKGTERGAYPEGRNRTGMGKRDEPRLRPSGRLGRERKAGRTDNPEENDGHRGCFEFGIVGHFYREWPTYSDGNGGQSHHREHLTTAEPESQGVGRTPTGKRGCKTNVQMKRRTKNDSFFNLSCGAMSGK